MTATERARRTAEADELCASAYEKAGGSEVGAALVAVGGYGRAELAPYSDLDVVLVADDGVELGEVAERVWYPLWDSGSRLDHSVRSFPEMVATADADLKVALGLLDLRHLAGDPNLTLRLRATMLTGWRRRARTRLPEMREIVRARHDLLGELAHLSVPDLKESEGGLRDATALNALVASWLVDVPHADLERCRGALLNVRDVLHATAGRATDRIAPELWGELADGLGLADDAAAQRHVRELGRRITHLSRLTWRRVDGVLARPGSTRGVRRPVLDTLSPGIALSAGEVVLDATARPAADPLLLLRAAALAAEHDAALGPATAARLVRESPPLPDPWPASARHLFVRLLASGRGLLPVWETLDETGALAGILPEWERIRMLPHASSIHRFTVDRHVVETCIEASGLIRDVARPDVLMVAALLHDIGKGGLTEHSVAGEPLARRIASRMGFDQEAVELVGTLVRWHLLLAETATTRDLDDPATVRHVAQRVGTPAAAELLAVLTEADARATSTKAWSTWRSGLIRGLGRRVLAELGPGPAVRPVPPVDVEVPASATTVPSPSRSSPPTAARPCGSSPWTGSACWRTKPPCSRCNAPRCGPPTPGRSRSTASPCGRWPRSTSTRPCSDSGSRPSPRAGSTRGSGCVRTPPRPSRPRSSYAPRRRRRPPCWRCARRTVRGPSTWSAPPWRGWAWPSGPLTSTPSGRRRSTCSTSRRRARARCRTSGRPMPPTPCGPPSRAPPVRLDLRS